MCKDFDLIMRDRCYKDVEKIIGDDNPIITCTASAIIESFNPLLSHNRAPRKERDEIDRKEKITLTPSQIRDLQKFI